MGTNKSQHYRKKRRQHLFLSLFPPLRHLMYHLTIQWASCMHTHVLHTSSPQGHSWPYDTHKQMLLVQFKEHRVMPAGANKA